MCQLAGLEAGQLLQDAVKTGTKSFHLILNHPSFHHDCHHHFQPFQQLLPNLAISNLFTQFKQFPTMSSHFKLFPATHPFPAMSSHFLPFPAIPAISSHFIHIQSAPAMSSHVQPFPAGLFPALFSNSSK